MSGRQRFQRMLILSMAAYFASVVPDTISAADSAGLSEEQVAERATDSWESGATDHAIEIIEGWTEHHKPTRKLNKLRGDILATSRHPGEAIQAYDAALADDASALDIRWAKWGVMTRTGQGDDAIEELQHIANLDSQNPLVHLRLAQELRNKDRLEESLDSYKKAVELAPDLLNWRLAMARARFDVLDYQGAADEVQYVLHRIAPGSALEIPAQNLLADIYGDSKDRGRRFVHIFKSDETEEQLKEWALIRAEGWRLFVDGRYDEAEPIYKKVLALNPKDPTAHYQFGLILMKLGRCEEALKTFRLLSDMEVGDEEYTDSVFRRGQCLVQLERWSDAYVHFQILYDAAMEFEERNKGMELPPGTRVLDKQKLAKWLDRVRPHVPPEEIAPPQPAQPPKVLSEDEMHAKIAAVRLTHKPLDTRASLMGRDADFSWFRFVIPSAKVLRDDFPTGAHEFIPVKPGDTFPTTQHEIFLVFGLVSASYDAIPLTAQCFVEQSETTGQGHAVAQDEVMMAMNDQSGYFTLSPPASGWSPGLYRCGLFAGDRTSAYTHVDEVRFRLIPVLSSS
ncbi:conserved exported protein of unknown function [Nitrospira sp. KM1]|uniref:tetratricopeptide repeat protein n=1 Tax=Nitrospira sp. KM1 TaxID=1936990 RepID=UPI0013A78793|nr:tetratricopeptide repeat protein [Nitrospira sp. KM1]BCA53610.1 conserved exported protein of unknown function [Nitrospira sp. KM1]